MYRSSDSGTTDTLALQGRLRIVDFHTSEQSTFDMFIVILGSLTQLQK